MKKIILLGKIAGILVIMMPMMACNIRNFEKQDTLEINIRRFNTEIHPELQPALKNITPILFDVNTIEETRKGLNSWLVQLNNSFPVVDGVNVQDIFIPDHSKTHDIRIRKYLPQNITRNIPVFLWIHGGGLVIGTPEQDDTMMKRIAKQTGIYIFSIDYRLAPENKYPTAIEDCYSSLKWIADNANTLGIDRSKIAIGGASAGGGLAAALSILAKDRGEIDVEFQLLIYPMLDDRNVAQTSSEIPDAYVWNRQNNLFGWSSYLPIPPGSKDVPIYASASRAKNLKGLPKAFIAVGNSDLFYEEDIQYAKELKKAGVPVELHVYKGAYHGFDLFAHKSSLANDLNNKIINAIKNTLSIKE